MKRKLRLIVIGIGLLLCAALFTGANSFASTVTLDVRAFIDGSDYLTIQGDTLTWTHRAYDMPGTWSGTNYPVTVSTSLNGVPVSTVQWYEPRTASPAALTGLSPAIPATSDMMLTVVEGRYSLSVEQAPTAANGYTTIILFNDDPPGGAAWYEAKLDYTTAPVPIPGAAWLLGPGLVGLIGLKRKYLG